MLQFGASEIGSGAELVIIVVLAVAVAEATVVGIVVAVVLEAYEVVHSGHIMSKQCLALVVLVVCLSSSWSSL